MAPIIDVDQHFFEPRTMWRDYIDPAFRDRALSIDDDELGYAWLTWQGRRLYLAEVQIPAKAKPIGEMRQRLKRGEPAEHRYDDVLPIEYGEAAARAKTVEKMGLDAAVLIPNFALLWEDMLSEDIPAVCANMRACNRWMASSIAQGEGRLVGVGHMTLQDPAWAQEEIARLATDGITIAMVGPTPVNGKAFSHPDVEPIWRAFADHGVSPMFHVGGFRKVFDPAWYEPDPEPVDKELDSALLWVPAAVAIENMIVHGVFDRVPELRVGVIEMTAHWVPEFMVMLEGALGFYTARHGEPPKKLELKPSEYFQRHVRVGAMAYEQPAKLVDLAGDVFMFGSDWPHAEGVADPLGDFQWALEGLSEGARDKLLGENAAWLLHRN